MYLCNIKKVSHRDRERHFHIAIQKYYYMKSEQNIDHHVTSCGHEVEYIWSKYDYPVGFQRVKFLFYVHLLCTKLSQSMQHKF